MTVSTRAKSAASSAGRAHIIIVDEPLNSSRSLDEERRRWK